VVVGASGAVLGLCAAVLVDLMYASASMRMVWTRVVFVLVAGINLLVDVSKTKTASRTSRWSHIGGAVCGFATAALLLPLLPVASARAAPARPALTTSPRQRAALTLRRAGQATLSTACVGVLIFSYVILPLNLAGMLEQRSFAGQPKACAATCKGWCACVFSAADAAGGAPCLMVNVALGTGSDGSTDVLRTLRGALGGW
jgi:hypothetical protein